MLLFGLCKPSTRIRNIDIQYCIAHHYLFGKDKAFVTGSVGLFLAWVSVVPSSDVYAL